MFNRDLCDHVRGASVTMYTFYASCGGLSGSMYVQSKAIGFRATKIKCKSIVKMFLCGIKRFGYKMSQYSGVCMYKHSEIETYSSGRDSFVGPIPQSHF